MGSPCDRTPWPYGLYSSANSQILMLLFYIFFCFLINLRLAGLGLRRLLHGILGPATWDECECYVSAPSSSAAASMSCWPWLGRASSLGALSADASSAPSDLSLPRRSAFPRPPLPPDPLPLPPRPPPPLPPPRPPDCAVLDSAGLAGSCLLGGGVGGAFDALLDVP